MKKYITLTLAGLFSLSMTSCHTMGPNAKNDAGTGALIGGAAGAFIGHQSGRTAV